MYPYKYNFEDEEESYKCYGVKLTPSNWSASSYINAVINMIFHLDRNFAFKLPKMLLEAQQNGWETSLLMEAVCQFVKDYDLMLINCQNKMLDCETSQTEQSGSIDRI